MRRLTRAATFAGALSMGLLAAPATATIIIVPANSIQGANVLFNDGVQTGATVTGFTNVKPSPLVSFTGSTVGGGDVIRASGGQARIDGALNAATQNPNDTLLLSGLQFGLSNGGTFNNLEFNLFGAGATATAVNFMFTDNMGEVFNFSQAIGNGENFFGFQGIDGQSIRTASLSLVGGGIQDVRQIRLDAVPSTMSAVPEPATWAFMLVGFGAVGYSMRKRPNYKFAQAV